MNKSLEQIWGEQHPNSDGDIMVNCLWHDDSSPSLSINETKGCYHCFGCGKRGHILQLIKEFWNCDASLAQRAFEESITLKVIPDEKIYEWHSNLLNAGIYYSFLTTTDAHASFNKEGKGLTPETISKYLLGYQPKLGRITIPIFNQFGKCIQVRKYHPQLTDKKFLNTSSNIAFFPHMPGEEKEIYLCEGEWDTLLLRQNGVNAYCVCGGAGTWKNCWNVFFQGKVVHICYDPDTAGKRGSTKVANLLASYVEDLFIKTIPYEGDVSDWILRGGGTVQEFLKLEGDRFLVALPQAVDIELDLDVSLRTLLDSFHYTNSPVGRVYRQAIRVPPYIVSDSVIEWIKHHGGRFFWEASEGQGYLAFQKQLYPLNSRDQFFKSFMYKEAGVTRSTHEGILIMEAVCSMAHGAPKDTIYPWITSNPKNMWEILWAMHDGHFLSITPNNVAVKDIMETPVLQHLSKEWFIPFKYNKDADIKIALDMLREFVVDNFMMNDVQKEILICWILSLPLSGFATVRPGMRLYGEADSGKSTTLHMLFSLIYGTLRGELPTCTTAALWRIARREPILFLDNQNVGDLKEDLRTFFDLSATGGQRLMAAPGSSQDTVTQSVLSLAMVTGLDSFMTPDVLSRYYTLETDPALRKDFFAPQVRLDILKNRDFIISGWLNLISQKVLPNMQEASGMDKVKVVREKLGVKKRTAEYFSLMQRVAEAGKEYGFIKTDPDMWPDYIHETSSEQSKETSATLEWWEIFRHQLQVHMPEAHVLENTSVGCKMKFETTPELLIDVLLSDTDHVIGVKGSPPQMLLALRWAATQSRAMLPWRDTKELGYAYRSEKAAWKEGEYVFKNHGGAYHTIKWTDTFKLQRR